MKLKYWFLLIEIFNLAANYKRNQGGYLET